MGTSSPSQGVRLSCCACSWSRYAMAWLFSAMSMVAKPFSMVDFPDRTMDTRTMSVSW